MTKQWSNWAMWLALQFLIMGYIIMRELYFMLVIPLFLIAFGLLGKRWYAPQRIDQKSCKHEKKHIIKTKEYSYCYLCGKKVEE